MKFISLFLLAIVSLSAVAENATYGNVTLYGLARDGGSWEKYPGIDNVMVCNLNGPDRYLSVREYPTTDAQVVRNLKRLAILKIDTAHRVGHFVQILQAWRDTDTEGWLLSPSISFGNAVGAWVDDGYLCTYVDEEP